MKTRNKNNCLFLNLWLLWYFSSVFLYCWKYIYDCTSLRMRCDLILYLIYDRNFFLCIIKAKSVINFIVCFQKKNIFMIVIRSYLPNSFYLNMAYTCLLLSFINILQIDIKMYYCNYNNWCLFCQFFSSCCAFTHKSELNLWILFCPSNCFPFIFIKSHKST